MGDELYAADYNKEVSHLWCETSFHRTGYVLYNLFRMNGIQNLFADTAA